MADLIFVAVAAAFFAVCLGYVRALDRMVQSKSEPRQGQEPS